MLVYNPCHILVQTCIFGLGDLLRKYYMNDLWLSPWHDDSCLTCLMSYENAWNSNDMLKWKSMNWWLLFLNAKLVWKSLWDFNEYHSKDFTIQMSLILYWLNMVTIIRVSHPEKSNRVQKSLMPCFAYNVGYSCSRFEINKSLYPCFSHDKWWNWFEFI